MPKGYYHIHCKEAIKTLKLSTPIILGELTQMLVHIIDIAMVGRLSYKHLAAAALANSIINVPFILGVGITISFSQLVAAANGQKDKIKISRYLFNGLLLCSCLAFILSLSLHLSSGILLHLNQDDQVAKLAIPYLRIMGWSLTPLLIFLALKHFVDGLEMTKIGMLLSVGALPINILLNWLLIYGNLGFPKLGLLGAGWGTLITRSLILITLILVILGSNRIKQCLTFESNQWRLHSRSLKDFLFIGIPISLQLGLEISAFAGAAVVIGSFGPISQAAHQIAFSCLLFALMISLGVSQGSSIRISNAWGQNDWQKIRVIAIGTILTIFLYTTATGVIFYSFRDQLPLFFNTKPSVVAMSSTLLTVGIFFQAANAMQVVATSILRGIKDINVPILYTFIAYWLIGLPLGYALGDYLKLDVIGIWIGFMVGLTVSIVLLFRRLNIKLWPVECPLKYTPLNLSEVGN